MAFYRITVHMTFKFRTFQNVFHVEDVAVPALDPQIIPDIIENLWIPPFFPQQYIPMTYDRIDVHRVLVPAPPAPVTKFINLTPTGSSQVTLGVWSFKLLFHTGLLGRKHRGRLFIAGIAQSLVDFNTERMIPAAVNLNLTLANTLTSRFVGDGASSGLALVIKHKDPTETPTRVTSIGFDQVVCFLRSRKVGVGI